MKKHQWLEDAIARIKHHDELDAEFGNSTPQQAGYAECLATACDAFEAGISMLEKDMPGACAVLAEAFALAVSAGGLIQKEL